MTYKELLRAVREAEKRERVVKDTEKDVIAFPVRIPCIHSGWFWSEGPPDERFIAAKKEFMAQAEEWFDAEIPGWNDV